MLRTQKKINPSATPAALIINSSFGAAGVALGFIFFWVLSKNYLNSTLLAAIFGLSMSQIFFGSVPSFSSLGICCLLASYILFFLSLSSKRIALIPWVLVGVFCLGTTMLNFAQVLIFFIVLVEVMIREGKTEFSSLSEITGLIIPVLYIGIAISIAQNLLIYSPEGLIFSSKILKNLPYASLTVFYKPFSVIASLLKHFFLVNFAAPFPDTFMNLNGVAPEVPRATFTTSWNYSAFGWIGLCLWLILLGAGAIKSLIFDKKNRVFLAAVGLSVIFYMVFHAFYGTAERVSVRGGIEYFEYSGNFTFLVFIFLSCYSLSRSLWVRLFLFSLALFFGYNNIAVIRKIIEIYK